MRLLLFTLFSLAVNSSLGNDTNNVYFNNDSVENNVSEFFKLNESKDKNGQLWFVLISGVGRMLTPPFCRDNARKCPIFCQIPEAVECKKLNDDWDSNCLPAFYNESTSMSISQCKKLHRRATLCDKRCYTCTTIKSKVCTEDPTLFGENFLAYAAESDISRAYQILRSHGVPDERIIVFMDDIMGPWFNGTLYNEEGGPNVYQGVPKDYVGIHWNKNNLYRVLKGEKMNVGSRKTLATGPNDKLFINFVGHGGVGASVFGNFGSDIDNPIDNLIYANELNEIFENMNRDKRFGEMVVFWMSCFSGSMFDKFLKNDTKVYAVSAQKPSGYSWACASRSSHKGETGTGREFLPLCSVFNRSWNSLVEKKYSDGKGTIGELFRDIKEETLEATKGWTGMLRQEPMDWGDMKIKDKQVEEILGKKIFKPYQFDESQIVYHNITGKGKLKAVPMYQMAKDQPENRYIVSDEYKDHRQMKYDRITMAKRSVTKVDAIIKETIRLQNIVRRFDHSMQERTLSWNEAYHELSQEDMTHCFLPMTSFFKKTCNHFISNIDDWYTMIDTSKEFLVLCHMKVEMKHFYKSVISICSNEEDIDIMMV